MNKIFKRALSGLVLAAFMATQAFALAPSVASDGDINPPRSAAVQSGVAGQLEPGAIGNGKPLVELVNGKIPPYLKLDDTALARIDEAIKIAIDKCKAALLATPAAHKDRLQAALENLIELKDNLNNGTWLYSFNAVVTGQEDYLLGFSTRYARVGLAAELVNGLSLKRLAQYVAHECVPEKGNATTREDHRLIYNEILGLVFGRDEVDGLKSDLRGFINSRASPQAPVEIPDAGQVSVELEASAPDTSALKWMTPEDATKRIEALPNIGTLQKLQSYYHRAETDKLTYTQIFEGLRGELAQMAQILRNTRPTDEMTPLVGYQGIEERDLDILRSMSEFILQFIPEKAGTDNIQRLKEIKSMFARHPEVSKLFIEYFKTKFDPRQNLEIRGKAAQQIRLIILKLLDSEQDMTREEHSIFYIGMQMLVAAVKTDYYVPDRIELFMKLDPRALVLLDRTGTLTSRPPAVIIWVHVPYGAYGAHARYAEVARGGLRCINPNRTEARNKILPECINLASTQDNKHTDIPEGGSKGAFIYNENLSMIASAIAYIDGLINCMVDNNGFVTVASGTLTADPLELGPDEGTADIASIATIRSWMKGLKDWRLLMTGKLQALGGTSHMENNLLTPPERGNRVTSQGVTQHAFEFVRYLRDIGRIKSKDGEPIRFAVTGGLDGDVASGLVERSIAHYGDKAKICSVVDASGVIFDPEGLDHDALMHMYNNKLQAVNFPKDKLHKGGFVAPARPGFSSESYVTLNADALSAMNRRALSPDFLKEIGVEEKYMKQAKLKDGEPLIVESPEKGADGFPVSIRVHSMYLRSAMFFLAKVDMLLTGGGVRYSIDNANWKLFFDWDEAPVASSITHGANVFIETGATRALEARGVMIEPDEKANSVGVEISSKMEIDFNLMYDISEIDGKLMAAYFEQVLARCLYNARWKFWALRMDAEDNPGKSVVTEVSPAMSADINRLSELIQRSNIIGGKKGDYSESAFKHLKGYFPDVWDIDRKYAATIDRVFAKMPTARIEAIAARTIARDIVLSLGTGAVGRISKLTGASEAAVIKNYIEVSDKMGQAARIKDAVDNPAGLTPRQQLEKLRGIRKEVASSVTAAMSPINDIIESISNSTFVMARRALNGEEAPIDMSKTIVIMRKGMGSEVLRGKGALGSIMGDAYIDMERKLRDMLDRAGSRIVEVDTDEEILEQANSFMSQTKTEHGRVIILDDGNLSDGLQESDLAGTPGKDYCVVTSQASSDLDGVTAPFINLNAMVMMGMGVLDNNTELFESAYKAFTGKSAIPEETLANLINRLVWLVRAAPRTVRFSTDVLKQKEEVRKIFAAAA